MTASRESWKWFEGCVAEIMSPGKAIELIQPWHTPVSTTPMNTGMALGGIGNAVTVTPAGTTPSIHFVPGLFIESTAEVPVRMTNFFYRERSCGNFFPEIRDSRRLRLFLQVAPLVDSKGLPWFGPKDPLDLLERKLAAIVNCSTFYKDNKENLEKWEISLSDSTRKLIDDRPEDCRSLNYSLLLDIFPGCIADKHNYATSLVADVEEKSIDNLSCYPAGSVHYRGLYPVSETEYKSSAHRCKVIKRHISPIVQHNAKSCSLPLLHTEFVIENPTEEAFEISILQVQENIVGYEVIKSRKNEQDAVFHLQRAINGQVGESASFALPDGGFFKGITLKQSDDARRGDLDGRIHIGVCYQGEQSSLDVTLSGSDFTAEKVTDLYSSMFSGRISQRLRPITYSGKEPVSGGVCATKVLQPGETVTFSFVMILDFPSITLGNYKSEKKYVQYFPDAESRLPEIVSYYFCHEDSALSRIRRTPAALTFSGFLENYRQIGTPGLANAEALKIMFANGFSFLAESAVWDKQNNFYIRECADYPFFNSLDVYFYGSFGLMYLLPECDTHNIQSFADAVFSDDARSRRYWVYSQVDFGEVPDSKYTGPRNPGGAVPHDMGNPFDAEPNAYTWNDVKYWKDLAPKFILLVLRNYRFTGDESALRVCWPAAVNAIEFLWKQVQPAHCVPLATGVDDTFDNISSYGISIYCASLWVAGLRAASEIAGLLGEESRREEYSGVADLSQEYLRQVLWDDEQGYYHYYSSPVTASDIDPGLVGNAMTVLEELGIAGDCERHLDIESLVEVFNRFLYAGDLMLPAHLLKERSSKIKEWIGCDCDNPSSFRKLCLKEQRVVKKLVLFEVSGGLLRPDFKKKITLESDDVFADQLVADLYLSLLGLEPITPLADKVRVLQKVRSTNYLANSPEVGAANLVTKEGSSLPDFQAQDVWVGVQFSIAACMLDCEMFGEFDELVRKLYDNIYDIAKVPFGIPEGFNCNNNLEEKDLVYALNVSNTQAEYLVERLKSLGVISADNRVAEEVLGQVAVQEEIVGALRRAGIPETAADELLVFLNAASIKLTAGRYFRAGMIYSIAAVMEKAGFIRSKNWAS